MTVAELISMLQKEDPEHHVAISGSPDCLDVGNHPLEFLGHREGIVVIGAAEECLFLEFDEGLTIWPERPV